MYINQRRTTTSCTILPSYSLHMKACMNELTKSHRFAIGKRGVHFEILTETGYDNLDAPDLSPSKNTDA